MARSENLSKEKSLQHKTRPENLCSTALDAALREGPGETGCMKERHLILQLEPVSSVDL